jgi:aspartate/methionine/tyrosine aminotransferase
MQYQEQVHTLADFPALPDLSRFTGLSGALYAKTGNKINASVGNPLNNPHPLLADAVHKSFANSWRYGNPNGDFQTRNAAIKLFDHIGVTGLQISQVIVGNGSTNLYSAAIDYIDHLTRPSHSDAQRVFLVATPTYGLFTIHPSQHNFQVVGFPLFAEHDWKPHPSIIEDVITRIHEEGAKVVAFLNINPHNPTGAVVDQNSAKELAQICIKHDLFAIDDMVYKWLEYDNRESCPLAAIDGMRGRTITLSSLSKSFNCPGLRAGIACGPESAIMHISDKLRNSLQSVSSVTQAAIISASKIIDPSSSNDFLEECKEQYQFRAKLFRTMIDGEAAAGATPQERKEIKSILRGMLQPEMLSHVVDCGIPGVNIINRTLEAGYFYLLDFSDYQELYYRDLKINDSYDLVTALVHEAKTLALPSEFMLASHTYPMAMRVSLGLKVHDIVRLGRAIYNTLVNLTDEPT